MENGGYVKWILAGAIVIALCIAAGIMIPGSPIKPTLNNVASSIFSGGNNANIGPMTTYAPGDTSYRTSGDTLLNAIRLAGSDPVISGWMASHAGWVLSQADTSHMDINGKADEWTLVYVDSFDMMIVSIRGGKIVSSNAFTTSTSVNMGITPEGLADSTTIMGTLKNNCPGLVVGGGNTPFSLNLLPGASPTYKVDYMGSGASGGFSCTFNATTGELLENTYSTVS